MTEEEKLAQAQAEQQLKEELEAKEKLNKEGKDKEDETEESKSSADSLNPEEEDKKIPYSRFKEIVDERNRLAKEKEELEKVQQEAKTKELEEQERYKELYEQALESINQFKAESFNTKIEQELREAGYKDEQVAKLSKLVEGETDEDIKKSIEDLKIAFPTKTYVDPSPDQRKRHKPDGVDGDDIGKSIFDRLKESGKLKGFK